MIDVFSFILILINIGLYAALVWEDDFTGWDNNIFVTDENNKKYHGPFVAGTSTLSRSFKCEADVVSDPNLPPPMDRRVKVNYNAAFCSKIIHYDKITVSTASRAAVQSLMDHRFSSREAFPLNGLENFDCPTNAIMVYEPATTVFLETSGGDDTLNIKIETSAQSGNVLIYDVTLECDGSDQISSAKIGTVNYVEVFKKKPKNKHTIFGYEYSQFDIGLIGKLSIVIFAFILLINILIIRYCCCSNGRSNKRYYSVRHEIYVNDSCKDSNIDSWDDI